MCAEGAERVITRGRHENLGHYKTETLKIRFKNVAKYLFFLTVCYSTETFYKTKK